MTKISVLRLTLHDTLVGYHTEKSDYMFLKFYELTQ